MHSVLKTETLADEQIRKAVAAAIQAQSMIDVRSISAIIATHNGVRLSSAEIETRLSEAAVAARVPIYL